MKSALVISHQTPVSTELCHALRSDAHPCDPLSAASLNEARALLAQTPADLVFLDVDLLEDDSPAFDLDVAPSKMVFMIGHL